MALQKQNEHYTAHMGPGTTSCMTPSQEQLATNIKKTAVYYTLCPLGHVSGLIHGVLYTDYSRELAVPSIVGALTWSKEIYNNSSHTNQNSIKLYAGFYFLLGITRLLLF